MSVKDNILFWQPIATAHISKAWDGLLRLLEAPTQRLAKLRNLPVGMDDTLWYYVLAIYEFRARREQAGLNTARLPFTYWGELRTAFRVYGEDILPSLLDELVATWSELI